MRQTVKRFRLLLLCLSGILTGLCIVFPKVGSLAWASLIPMALVLFVLSEDGEISLRKMYLHGLVFFVSFSFVIFHWFLSMYPMEFMEIPKGAALFVVLIAWIGLSIVQSLASALIFPVFAFVFRNPKLKRVKFLFPFFAGVLWAAIEWSQTIGWWGIPWGRLCISQTEGKLMLLSASLFGSYFVSFLIVLFNFCVAMFLLCEQYKKFLIGACACIIAGNIAIGCSVMLLYNNEGNQKKTVGVVQGNIDLSEKWTSETTRKIEKAQKKYTLEAGEKGADIVVWAETVFPHDINKGLAEFISELAQESGTTIIAASFTEPDTPIYAASGKPRSYNSLYEVRKNGDIMLDGRYSKQRLVPFAEFVPLRGLVEFIAPPLADLNMMSDDIIAGEESVVLDTEEGKIGCAICFDSVYENISLEAVRGGAEFMLVSTNDAWFATSAENSMHTAQSKLRAIETGRYVVRVANTGISGIINPLGEFEDKMEIGEEGLIVGDIYLRNQTTLYTVIGNIFAYICVAVGTAGLGFSIACAVIDKKKQKASEEQK